MTLSRRTVLFRGLGASLAAYPLVGCTAASPVPEGATRIHVMGVIHSGHRTSQSFSLAVLDRAIRRAAPDVILTEIPPDRVSRAITSFAETGEVQEPRTKVFPEYTDVVFPLSRELDYRIEGTAGWTKDIADNRRAALERIEADPARQAQWQAHREAQRAYTRQIAGRGDDPHFIHTDEFDRLVEESRTPYQRYFDEDLGPGGWTQINRAHTDLINQSLDSISGKGLTALIMFGTAHKYMIRRSLANRGDIVLQDTAALFG